MNYCINKPIDLLFKAAALLSDAVDAHVAGMTGDAKRLIEAADIPEIREWHWPIISRWPWQVSLSEPQAVPKELRAVPRMPGATMRKLVMERDGHHCRFCGVPVIATDARKAMIASYGEVIPWSRQFWLTHAGFPALQMSLDHMVPHQRGGESIAENLVVACDPCNYGRMSFTLNEVGVLNPLLREPSRDHWSGFADWDGLQRFRQ